MAKFVDMGLTGLGVAGLLCASIAAFLFGLSIMAVTAVCEATYEMSA